MSRSKVKGQGHQGQKMHCTSSHHPQHAATGLTKAAFLSVQRVLVSGYKTYLILDATRGINPLTVDTAVAAMKQSGKCDACLLCLLSAHFIGPGRAVV